MLVRSGVDAPTLVADIRQLLERIGNPDITAPPRLRLSIGKVAAALAIVVLLMLAYPTLPTCPKLMTADLCGMMYVVDFWATSCAICTKEMPQMIETYNKFKGPDFDFIAVSMKYDPPMYVANYTKTRQLPFRVAMDSNGSLEGEFDDVAMTPTTFLIDKKGKILKHIAGELDFPAFDRLIEQALAQPAS